MSARTSPGCAKADAARIEQDAELQQALRSARERALEQSRGYQVLRDKGVLRVRCSWDRHPGEVVATVTARGQVRIAHAHARVSADS